MTAWWFGVNNSRESRADGDDGHMHYRDVLPLLRDGTTITWPFGGAPGSKKLNAEMAFGDDVVLWMGDGVEPAWGILGVAKIEAVDRVGQHLSLRRAGGPWLPITPYPAGKPASTTVATNLQRIFGDSYGPLRKLWKKLGVAGVKQKVVTIDRVDEAQLASVREMLVSIRDRPTSTTFSSLPLQTRKIIATAARFIQQRRPEFYFATDEGGGKLRIYCGRIVPLSARPEHIWLSVTESLLPASVAGCLSWSWDEHSEHPRYKRTPSRNGFYTPSKDPSGAEWETIAPAFFDYLGVLCMRGHRADHRTQSTPGLCEEIVSWGDLEVETVSFEQAVRVARRSSSDERRERLRRASRKPTVLATVVNVFQRNPDVVAEVLARAAGTCELCSSPAPFVRASDGTPYLEVHHRVRLADGGDDTVENAVAACPNCHRRAHFG